MLLDHLSDRCWRPRLRPGSATPFALSAADTASWCTVAGGRLLVRLLLRSRTASCVSVRCAGQRSAAFPPSAVPSELEVGS